MPAAGLSWRPFLLPKRGNAVAECEDAIAADPASGRFAIADGASESYAAGEWAKHLTAAFVHTGATENWLVEPRAKWQEQVSSQAVAWYAEDKYALGAHATFLGVTIARSGKNSLRWTALAAGDACLIVVRDGAIESAFPLDRSDAFSGSPPLVRSWGEEPMWEFGMGDLQPGDRLLMATDALSQCLIASAEGGAFAGPEVLNLTDGAAFAAWIDAARTAGRLKNDDVALGIVEYGKRP